MKKTVKVVYSVVSGDSNHGEHQSVEIVYPTMTYPHTNEMIGKSVSLVGVLIIAMVLTIGVYRKLKAKCD